MSDDEREKKNKHQYVILLENIHFGSFNLVMKLGFRELVKVGVKAVVIGETIKTRVKIQMT